MGVPVFEAAWQVRWRWLILILPWILCYLSRSIIASHHSAVVFRSNYSKYGISMCNHPQLKSMVGVSSSKMKEVHNLEVWRYSEFEGHRLSIHPDTLQPLGEGKPRGCAGLTNWTNLSGSGSSQRSAWAEVKKNTCHQISGEKKSSSSQYEPISSWRMQLKMRETTVQHRLKWWFQTSDMLHFHGFQLVSWTTTCISVKWSCTVLGRQRCLSLAWYEAWYSCIAVAWL